MIEISLSQYARPKVGRSGLFFCGFMVSEVDTGSDFFFAVQCVVPLSRILQSTG